MIKLCSLSLGMIFLVLSLNLSAQGPTAVPGGNVSGTWTKTNSPYQVQGDITIASGDTLTIEPGVTVEILDYYKLTVNGQIFAVGETNDTIIFTVDDHSDFDTDLNDPAGSWNGIEFFNTSDSSLLDRCKFQYAKAVDIDPDDLYDHEGGAFRAPSGVEKLIIRRSHFYYNYAEYGGGAIATRSSGFLVEACRFTNNRSGSYGGAIFGGDGKLKVYDNYFAHNEGSSGGAIGFWGGSDYDFRRNVIIYNSASSGGAIYSIASTYKLTNNFITNNYASFFGGAIYASSTAYPVITGNLIVNNTAGSVGGGLYLNETNAVLTNNTICKNTAGIGGGIASNNSNPEIQNSIISGNEPQQIYIYTNLSSPDIYYSNLEDSITGIGGSTFQGEYENNTELSLPGFESPSPDAGYTTDGYGADWSLQPSSPCINGGNPETYQFNLPENDVYGNVRIRNNIVDMGAAETHISVTDITGDITTDQYWFSDTVKIYSDVTIADGVTLSINAGTVVQFQDYYMMTVEGVILAEGTETNLIEFTVPADKRATGWAGLEFDNSSGIMTDNDPSLIDYCRIEYAKKLSGGGLQVSYFSDLTVSNSVFMHDSAGYKGAAIHVDHCSPLIKDNIISCNHADRGSIASSYGSPVIIGNTITHNTQGELLGGIFGWWSNFLIQDNFIANNEGGFYAFASNTKEYVLINNIIVNNTQYGIRAGGINVYALNNTVVNNDGYGINSYEANLNLINNIFYGNNSYWVNSYDNPSGNTVNIFNCDIEGGLNSIIDPLAPNLNYDDIIDEPPSFVSPTAGPEWTYESVPGDWKLLSVSPCIDGGLLDDFPYSLPATDILGKPRVNGNSIDIGAVENQKGPPEILTQPVGGIKCTGDSIIFGIEVNDTVDYQWQKEGIDIPGANWPTLEIDSLTNLHEGNYSCEVSNTYGTVTSGTVLLIVKSPPKILAEPESEWIQKGIDFTLEVTAEGTPPVLFQWFRDGDSIPNADKPLLRLLHTGYNHEGEYQCKITNVCGEAETTPARLYMAPEICMVTVDTATGNNLIVWEKQSGGPIVSYNIYREGIIAGLYDLIATVPYNDLSVFVDTAANPEVQAYWYKITAVDTSGYETGLDLCTSHKTIHLLVTMNPETGATQLDWDQYIGFEYGTYHILRSTQQSEFSIYHSMASSTTTWSDLNPEQDLYYYRVAVEKTDLCSPNGNLKASAGPYSHSMSNLEDNRLQQGQENNPPTLISLTDTTIIENQITGSFVGKLQTTDADTLDVHTYTLVNGTGSDDNNSFTIMGDLLLSAEVFDYETKSAYSIRVRSTDNGEGNLYTEQIFYIAVLDATEGGTNSAPSAITLSSDSIEENRLPGSLVGRFRTTDPDTSDAHTYKLVPGTGSDDNSSFSIMGDLLITAETFDYETRQQYQIRVRSTDNGTGNLYADTTFTIKIVDIDEALVNNAPTDIALDNNMIDENKPVGTMIGRLGTEDPDTLDSHTYSLVPGTGSDDNSQFTIMGDLLLSAETFDYEMTDSLCIRIRSMDNGEGRLYYEESFTILVNNIDEQEEGENNPPTLISLTDTTIIENQITGSFVGKLQTTDADTLDVHTYTLVNGTGSDDNNSFTIMGDLLLSAEVFDYETKSAYSIRVRSTDNGEGNLYTEQIFYIAVLDATEGGTNSAPSAITLSSDSIEENRLPGSLVGRFRTTDPDTSDAHTYKLVPGTGSDDNSSFSIMGDLLITAETFDYETRQQYQIRVRSTDNGTGNLYADTTFTIKIVDIDEALVNNAPTDIALDNNMIDENKPVGTMIGRFHTTDPDTLDSHTYSLVPGTGSDDNGSFTILGDLLLSAGTFDYELQDTLYIRIRSMDNGKGRLYCEKTFVIVVNDLIETGIDDVKNKTMLVYPNPFTRETNILFPNRGNSEYTLFIRDLSGKTVRIISDITSSRYVLHRDNLAGGYYLIELRGDRVFRGRIVVE